jgi:hypothetical protein
LTAEPEEQNNNAGPRHYVLKIFTRSPLMMFPSLKTRISHWIWPFFLGFSISRFPSKHHLITQLQGGANHRPVGVRMISPNWSMQQLNHIQSPNLQIHGEKKKELANNEMISH